MIESDDFYRELAAYIPKTLLAWYGSSSDAEVHKLSRLQGVLICLDASGFTALTKKLALEGRSGSENLTTLLNEFFENMSQSVFEHEGDVLKFAGDALWAFFPNDFNPENFLGLALNGLREVNQSNSCTQDDPLRIHIGAEYGSFSLASLGDTSFRLEVEPIGELVHTVDRACDCAGSNELFAGVELAKRSGLIAKEICNEEKFFKVTSQSTQAPKSINSSRHKVELAKHPQLRTYIPMDIVSRLSSAGTRATLQSEHRQVVSLFAYFEYSCEAGSVESIECLERLGQTLSKAFKTVRKMKGSIARIDPYGKGHKLLILFGAPQKLYQDELHAAACARELIGLTNEYFKIRIGASYGPLYCGDVGAQARREYTIMGEGANMAARLMSKANWGQILCDERLKSKMPNIVQMERQEFSLKGIGEHVPCFYLTKIEEVESANIQDVELVGRESELEFLRERWDRVSDARGNVTIITGDAGCGKTSLIASHFNEHEVDRVVITCKNSVLFGQNWLARKILAGLYAKWDQNYHGDLSDYASTVIEERWMPLIADLIDQSESENRWTKGLSSQLRSEKQSELYRVLISGLITSPRQIIIDDFDRADERSQYLVAEMAKSVQNTPLALILAVRQVNSMKVTSFDKAEKLEVCAPTNEEWLERLSQRFESGKREQELISRLLAATKGNPLCITDFINGCVDRGEIAVNSLSGKLELIESATILQLPEDIVGVHLSRFDKLQEFDRQVLKFAATSAGEFDSESVLRILSDSSVDSVQERLEFHVDTGVLEQNQSTEKFFFKHSSMREAIYSCIPDSELKRMHRIHADAIEATPSENKAEALAYHFFHGNEASKAFRYSLLSAIYAARAHSLTESASFFEQCASLLRESPIEDFESGQVFRFFFEYTRNLVLEGHFNRAYAAYRKWRRYGKSTGNIDESLKAATEMAKLLWKQSKYSRSQLALNVVISSAEKADNQTELARAYSALAEIERRTGKFDKAQERCEQSIRIAKEINDGESLSEAYNKLGLAQWGAGKLESAAKNYEKSLQAGRDAVGKYAEAQATNNLSIIHQAMGHYLEAETLLGNALEVFGDIGDKRNEAYASGNLGNVSRITGNFTEAENLYKRADAIFEKLNDRHAHFYTVGNLGDLDLTLGRLASAAERFDQSVKFAAEVGDRELEAECLVRIGELAFFSRKTSLAENRYRTAIEVANKIGSKEYAIRGMLGLARLYIGERESDQAAELIEKVAVAAKSEKAIIAEHEAIFLTGESHRIKNEIEQALNCYQRVLDYAKEHGAFELIFKSTARIYEVANKEKEIAAAGLINLSLEFIKKNDSQLWIEVIESTYFSYFSIASSELFGAKSRSQSHIM